MSGPDAPHDAVKMVSVIPCEMAKEPTGEWIAMNFNDEVRVRLTALGLQDYGRRLRELNQRLPPGKGFSEQPRLDAEGYYRTQLWSLASDFGHLCGLGMKLPFETPMMLRRPVRRSAP